MPGELMKALSETFQDVDGGYSAKRAGFFIFIGLLVAVVVGCTFFGTPFNLTIWTGLVELIKWIGAAILLERAPALATAIKGTPKP